MPGPRFLKAGVNTAARTLFFLYGIFLVIGLGHNNNNYFECMRVMVAASSKFPLLLGSGLSSEELLYVNAYRSDRVAGTRGKKIYFPILFRGVSILFRPKTICALDREIFLLYKGSSLKQAAWQSAPLDVKS